MAKINKTDVDIYHRALVSGLSGSGKSTLIAELAKEFKLDWIDLENSKDVLQKLPEKALENINYIRIPDSASFPIAAQTLMTLFKTGKANICTLHGKHDCAICKKEGAAFDVLDVTAGDPNRILVIDTITQLAASILAYTCKDKPVEYKPERDDWGALRKYSEFFASQFQAFPGNLVCACHAVEAEMEDGKTKLVPAFGSKDMSTKIAKAFGDLIYCDVKNKKHVAFCASTANNMVLTKSRSDFMIESLEQPSLIPLFKNELQAQLQAAATSAAANNVTPAQQAVKNLSSLSLLKK